MSKKDEPVEVILLDRESVVARVDALLVKHERNLNDLIKSFAPIDDEDAEEMTIKLDVKTKWLDGKVKHRVSISYSLGKVKEETTFYHLPGQAKLFDQKGGDAE